MSQSDSSDIEVISVKYEGSNPIKAETRLEQFIWNEISDDGSVISIASLRKALRKYDVRASETQIEEMIESTGVGPELSVPGFLLFLRQTQRLKSAV